MGGAPNGLREDTMRTVLGAICIAAACASATWAGDPSTPPALGDAPDGSEHSPADHADERSVSGVPNTTPRFSGPSQTTTAATESTTTATQAIALP
jgi:cytoskeletal protein RodZ